MKLELECKTKGCGLKFKVDWPENSDGQLYQQVNFSEEDSTPTFRGVWATYPLYGEDAPSIRSLMFHHNILNEERKKTGDDQKYGHGVFRTEGYKVSVGGGVVVIEKTEK